VRDESATKYIRDGTFRTVRGVSFQTTGWRAVAGIMVHQIQLLSAETEAVDDCSSGEYITWLIQLKLSLEL